MKIGFVLPLLVLVSACKFESAPAPLGSASSMRDAGGGEMQPGGAADAALGHDGTMVHDASTAQDAATPDRDAAMDAAMHAMDAMAADTDASDSEAPATDATEPEEDAGPVGGLKCADVFCPFTTAPLAPCCTAETDVEHGAAHAEERCGVSFAATGSDFFDAYCWQRDQPGVVDTRCPSVNVDLHTSQPGCCNDFGQCGSWDAENGLGCHLDPSASTSQSCGGIEPDDAGTDAGDGASDAGDAATSDAGDAATSDAGDAATSDAGDAATEDSGSPDAGPPDAGPPDSGMDDGCDLRGLYAIRMRVDLTWGGRSGGLWDLTDDGRGTLVVDMLASFDSVDPATLQIQAPMQPCGVQLPAFYSTTLCEAYQPIFPTSMWESSAMPAFPLRAHASCLEPGCIAGIEAQTVLLGIALANPEAPWPAAQTMSSLTCPAGTGSRCFPDHDGDSRPGLTVQVAKEGTLSGASYSCLRSYTLRAAPLSSSVAAIFDGIRRTDRLQLGVRMKVGGSVALQGASCNRGRGTGVAEFVNSRAWSCMVEPGSYNFPVGVPAGNNTACTSTEAQFMDANLPVYDILGVGQRPRSELDLGDTSSSTGPQISLVRLGAPNAAVSCADVRAAVQP